MSCKQILKKIIPETVRAKYRKKPFFQIVNYYIVKPISFLYRKTHQPIYICCERGFDAGDNAYFMHKYLVDKRCKSYFLLTKNSQDLYKFNKKEIIRYPHSLKTYFYVQAASYFLYTHSYYLPISIREEKLFRHFGKRVSLHHGITEKSLKALRFDFIVASNKQEQSLIMKQCNVDESRVPITGLARFDDLFNNGQHDKKLILVMPTWRRWLKSKDSILNSKFYKTWLALLDNSKFQEAIDAAGYKILFYPHYEVRRFFEDEPKFKEVTCDVHKLLLDCSILITDFSSVAFDVAYQKKPVIYYQFDEEEYFSKHLARGYYDYKNGVGYFAQSEEEVINVLKEVIANGINKKVIEAIEHFFSYIDGHNCDRIYDLVNKK